MEPTDEVLKRRTDALVAVFNRTAINKTFGMQLSFNAFGVAEIRLPYNPGLDNPVGVHGGVFATMLDTAGGYTAAARYDNWITTVDLHVQLLQPAKESGLRATAKLLRAGSRLSMTKMELHDDEGKLVAVGSATFSVTSVPHK
jgi:uncharacterized protein (TIGR00369 family)